MSSQHVRDIGPAVGYANKVCFTSFAVRPARTSGKPADDLELYMGMRGTRHLSCGAIAPCLRTCTGRDRRQWRQWTSVDGLSKAAPVPPLTCRSTRRTAPAFRRR